MSNPAKKRKKLIKIVKTNIKQNNLTLNPLENRNYQ